MHFPALFAIGLGTPEIILLIVLVVLLFGAKKLPELARGLGKAKSEFQKASAEVDKELDDDAPKSSAPKSKETAGKN